MPKTVLSGTAMITVSSDIFRAWIASGSVICLITSPIPSLEGLDQGHADRQQAERSGRRARRTGARIWRVGH